MAERVLLIEDDESLGQQIVDHLRRAGYEAVWWRSGRRLAPDDAASVSLVVLDLMLPGTYGADILKSLREHSEVPVLVLSARNDSHDKVRALALGADDYMTKPFWPDELIERVRARLRRPSLRRGGVIQAGPLRIDLEAREVQLRGKKVELTRVELDLLAELARRPGVPVTRKRLVELVLDPELEGTERSLDAHVSRLRKKLAGDELVETVWGIGYRLRADPAGR